MFENCFQPAYTARGTKVNKWGKDSTGLVEYQFNNYGFRSDSEDLESPAYAMFGSSAVFGVGVPVDQALCSLLPHCQNYGLSGDYFNHHSVTNLKAFLNSPLYSSDTKIVFFWIDRPGIEDIESMIKEVNSLNIKILHINQGIKISGAVNLIPHVDLDVSGTHPGPKTHKMWAKLIQQLTNRE